MKLFYSLFLLFSFLTISCTDTINREYVCGQWFHKSTKIYLYQDGTAYITNIRGNFSVSDDIPDTLTCKWKIEDKKSLLLAYMCLRFMLKIKMNYTRIKEIPMI